jgi:hypothetical protein
MNNQYELTNNMEDSFKLLRQAFMAGQGPSDADPTTGTTSFLPPDQDSTFASGSSLSSLNDSPSYLNESYRLLRQAFTSGDGSVGLSTGATSAAESAAVVTGAKRTAPWNPYEGLETVQKLVENLTGTTDFKLQRSYLLNIAGLLEPPRIATSASTTYSGTNRKTQQRKRAAIAPYISDIMNVVNMQDPNEIRLLLQDYVDKNMLSKRRFVTDPEVDDEAFESFSIGATFKNMSEKDQEMFLFLLEVDYDSIAEVLNQICPG